jgi:hypothetical protein
VHGPQAEEEVFKRSFIPRTLFDVVDAERDARKLADGDTAEVRVGAVRTGDRH